MDFDFLNTEAETLNKPLIPEVIEGGPNLTKVNTMTRKKFTQGVLNVYQELGGDVWLLQQAAIDPKGFLDMLKKLIPTNMNIDQMEGFSITLIDRYGNKAEIKPNESSNSPRAVELGPKPSQDRANEEPGQVLPEINLTDTYTPATPPISRLLSDGAATLLSDNTPKGFDFEL